MKAKAKNKATGDAAGTGSLAIRAAWLHYVGGMTQSAVAKCLNVPSVKAHRLIAKAVADGAVHVSIEGDIADCIQLEEALCQQYGLSSCEISPDLLEEGVPFRSLGKAGASRLRRWIESGDYSVIGIGHGRTLSAAVKNLPPLEVGETLFVSLLGSLTRNFSANQHDVMHQLAARTRAPAYVMPVPFFANTAEDRQVLLSQKGVSDVFEMARKAPLKFVGIGDVRNDMQLVLAGMIEPDEIEEVIQAGGVGEVLGNFYNRDGQLVETSITPRTLAAPIAGDGEQAVIALAGGANKVEAIKAVLHSGQLSGLITDEATAKSLLR